MVMLRIHHTPRLAFAPARHAEVRIQLLDLRQADRAEPSADAIRAWAMAIARELAPVAV